jgi:hypothetical protein
MVNQSGQIKDTVLRCKSKNWLAPSQDNVPEGRDMSTRRYCNADNK